MRKLPIFTKRWPSPQYCWSCAIVPGREIADAQFIWTTNSGTEYPLCGPCCMRWRQSCPRKDLPLRIRGLI